MMKFGKSTSHSEISSEILSVNSGGGGESPVLQTPKIPSDKPIQILQGALICTPLDDIVAGPNSGLIYIGENTIIHPKVILESGPNSGGIYIGKNNIIEEKVKIVNYGKQELVIGDYNWIQSSCTIESQMIGHRNLIEPRVVLERLSEVENDCHIGANCTIKSTECILNNTSVLGSNCQQFTLDPNDPHAKMLRTKHVETMEKQYEHLSQVLKPLKNSRLIGIK